MLDKAPTAKPQVDALDELTLGQTQTNEIQITSMQNAIDETIQKIANETDEDELRILENSLVAYKSRLEKLLKRQDDLKNKRLGKATMPLLEAPDVEPRLEAVNPVTAIITPQTVEQEMIAAFRDKNKTNS